MRITNVLVVDDDIKICRIIHWMLSDEQYKVQTSQSVADALRAVEQKHFDAYVIDCILPDGSGLDVAERIRSKWGEAPIILISGYDRNTGNANVWNPMLPAVGRIENRYAASQTTFVNINEAARWNVKLPPIGKIDFKRYLSLF